MTQPDRCLPVFSSPTHIGTAGPCAIYHTFVRCWKWESEGLKCWEMRKKRSEKRGFVRAQIVLGRPVRRRLHRMYRDVSMSSASACDN